MEGDFMNEIQRMSRIQNPLRVGIDLLFSCIIRRQTLQAELALTKLCKHLPYMYDTQITLVRPPMLCSNLSMYGFTLRIASLFLPAALALSGATTVATVTSSGEITGAPASLLAVGPSAQISSAPAFLRTAAFRDENLEAPFNGWILSPSSGQAVLSFDDAKDKKPPPRSVQCPDDSKDKKKFDNNSDNKDNGGDDHDCKDLSVVPRSLNLF
jgi:hypothetical protein